MNWISTLIQIIAIISVIAGLGGIWHLTQYRIRQLEEQTKQLKELLDNHITKLYAELTEIRERLVRVETKINSFK